MTNSRRPPAVATAVFWAYLSLTLTALVFVIVEPLQAANAVRAVGGWIHDIAQTLTRSLPQPLPT